jgi:hypothetical protein
MKSEEILKYSNPKEVFRKAKKYLGENVDIKLSTKENKKYMILDPKRNVWVHFGQMGYEDYTKHKDKKRQKNYLARATKMKGDWQNNPYSPNNLSIHILW